jgi:hypothetical protein
MEQMTNHRKEGEDNEEITSTRGYVRGHGYPVIREKLHQD